MPGAYWLCPLLQGGHRARRSPRAGRRRRGSPGPRLSEPVRTASADISEKIVGGIPWSLAVSSRLCGEAPRSGCLMGRPRATRRPARRATIDAIFARPPSPGSSPCAPGRSAASTSTSTSSSPTRAARPVAARDGPAAPATTPTCSVGSSWAASRWPRPCSAAARAHARALRPQAGEELRHLQARRGPRRRRAAGTLIEDVITTGGAVRDATNALREARRGRRDRRLRDRPQPARTRTRSRTSASRCGPCSPRPTWTPPARLSASTPSRGRRSGASLRAASRPPSARRAVAAVPPPLVGERDHRERQDQDGRSMFSPSHGIARAEEVAEQRDLGDPEHRADGAPDQEPAPLHPGDARHDGDVGAHERHEPADHQRLVAVLVEELLGLVEVLLLQDPAVAMLERRPDGRGRSRSPRRCPAKAATVSSSSDRDSSAARACRGRCRSSVGDEERRARTAGCRRAGTGRTVRTRRR